MLCRGLCSEEAKQTTLKTACKHTAPENESLQQSWRNMEKRVQSQAVHLFWPSVSQRQNHTEIQTSHYAPSVSINCLGRNPNSSTTAGVALLPTGQAGFEVTTHPLQQGPKLVLHNSRLGLLKSPPLLIPSSFISKILSPFPSS